MNDLWTTSRPASRPDRRQRVAVRVEQADRLGRVGRPDVGDPASGKVQMERLLDLLKSIRSAREDAARVA